MSSGFGEMMSEPGGTGSGTTAGSHERAPAARKANKLNPKSHKTRTFPRAKKLRQSQDHQDSGQSANGANEERETAALERRLEAVRESQRLECEELERNRVPETSRLRGRKIEQEWRGGGIEQERLTRRNGTRFSGNAAHSDISVALAEEILGTKSGASEKEVREAYARLIMRLHPDVGGSAYFAKQLNLARDALLDHRVVAVARPAQSRKFSGRDFSYSGSRIRIAAWILAISLAMFVCYAFVVAVQD
jgi:hypothetical protein